MQIDTEEQLEDKLSQPSPDDVAAMRALQGDILVLGVGGKMGPSLARLMQRSIDAAGVQKKIIAVARFTDPALPAALQADGIETITADLLDDGALDRLPDVPNVIFMAARKFGTTGAENTQLGDEHAAPRPRRQPLSQLAHRVLFQWQCLPASPAASWRSDRGNARRCSRRVRPIRTRSRTRFRIRFASLGHACHPAPPELCRRPPLWRALGYRHRRISTPAARHPHPALNAIGNATPILLLSTFEYCQSPPFILNLTGPETLSIRWIAEEFGKHFGCEPIFAGEESNSAYLSNAAKQHQLFGYPTVTPNQMIAWTAHWIAGGKRNLNKPTHFQTRDGKY